MRFGRAIVGVLGVLLSASSATAAERLVMEPYPGTWVDVVDQTANGVTFREQIPQGQTPKAFTDVLTTQTIKGYRGLPTDYLATTMAQLAGGCETSQTTGPTAGEEQGRQVAYGRVYCGRQKGESFGIHFFFKAILGSEGLYLVGRGFRTPGADHPGAPSFADASQAIAFLQSEGTATKYLKDQVYLCDPVFPDPKCASEAVPTGR